MPPHLALGNLKRSLLGVLAIEKCTPNKAEGPLGPFLFLTMMCTVAFQTSHRLKAPKWQAIGVCVCVCVYTCLSGCAVLRSDNLVKVLACPPCSRQSLNPASCVGWTPLPPPPTARWSTGTTDAPTAASGFCAGAGDLNRGVASAASPTKPAPHCRICLYRLIIYRLVSNRKLPNIGSLQSIER